MNIPTDNLNKCLAIGSLLIMVLLLNISLQNYERSKLSLIEVQANIDEYSYAVEKYGKDSDKLGKEFDDLKKSQVGKDTEDDIKAYLSSLLKLQQEHVKLNMREPEISKLKIKTTKLLHTAELHTHIKNIWFIISLVCFSICIITSGFGFYKWYKSENSSS